MIQSAPNFAQIISSVADGTRPANGWGTSVTPAQNAYGSYANLGVLSTSYTGYGLWLNVNSANVSAIARQMVITVGIDYAGGTTFTDWINGILVTGAGLYQNGGTNAPIWFYFPIIVPAGASLGVKASCSAATLTAFTVEARTAIRPQGPVGWYGTRVTSYGTNATTFGTAITPGTTAEGAWTAISGTLTVKHRYLEVGLGSTTNAMSNNIVHVDVGVGDATNKRVALSNVVFQTNAAELIEKPPLLSGWTEANVGDIIYARAQVGPNALDTDYRVAVYGVS